jgi:hypothetical protein
VGLLDRDSEEPQSKLRRYVILGLTGVLLLAVVFLYVTRYNTEKRTVRRFLDTVTQGDFERAYRLWQPKPTYTLKDFLDDWGPNGYYGPVKSYQIVTAQRPRGASGVVVVVEVSPSAPFPADTEREKLRQNKEVKLWVERETQSLSFAP